MVIYLMVTGHMIRQTALELTIMLMEANTKECGLTTYKMVKVKKLGRINLPIRANTKEGKSMVKASMSGQTVVYTVDLG